jgi:predicted metal-binding membrane protein
MPVFPFSLPGKMPARDFIAVAGSLLTIVAIAWWYLFSLSAGMSGDMDAAGASMDPFMPPPVWSAKYALMMFVMWAVMMIGMMLPSVTPTVMIYAMVVKKAAKDGKPVAATGVFVAGYLLVWAGFSVLAATGQYFLDKWQLLSPMMTTTNYLLGGSLLLIAGAWQFTPLKDQCLHQCRSPVEFIYKNWEKGNAGAVKMGVKHGLFCVGCCWALMLLLFVGGVMNLLWIALLSIFVLLEKILPFGRVSGKISGVLMIIAGLSFLML